MVRSDDFQLRFYASRVCKDLGLFDGCRFEWCEPPVSLNLELSDSLGTHVEQYFSVLGMISAGLPTVSVSIDLTSDLSSVLRTLEHACPGGLLAASLQDLMPIWVAWRIRIYFQEANEIKCVCPAELGRAQIGIAMIIPGMSSQPRYARELSQRLLDAVLSLADASPGFASEPKRSEARAKLVQIIKEPFKDGDVITASDLDGIERRIAAIGTRLSDLRNLADQGYTLAH
ncbi:hypothetical protein ACVMII_003901 [Bradyrhizobium diazoefficiens]